MSSIYKKLLEGYPKRIAKEILAEFAEPNPNASQRWIWELLQNAKDCSFPEGVNVRIELTDDYVEFLHNGRPFNETDLISLLTKDSSKTPNFSDDDKYSFFEKAITTDELSESEVEEYLNKTGKFGTGFMTTYLLSYKIELETIYIDDNGNYSILKIDLDREADKLSSMEEKVNNSFSVFNKIENLSETDYIDFTQREYNTKYRYNFNGKETSKKNAEKGIDNLKKSVHFTLAFVDTIKSVSITEHGTTVNYVKKSNSLQEGTYIVEILENDTAFRIAVTSSKNNIIQVAIPVKTKNDITQIEFIDEGIPTQFLSFPLINESKFDFPVIVNSPLFNPTEPRDSLLIQSNEDLQDNEISIKKAKLNKSIYEKCVDLYLLLLTKGIDNDWKNIEVLAKTNTPKNVDKEWFKCIQKKIRSTILESNIVTPAKGEIKIKPISTKFPICDKSENFDSFWNLCSKFIGERIPIKSQAETWQKIIYPNKNEYKNWESEIKFDIEDLLSIIQGESLNIEDTISEFFNKEPSIGYNSIIDVINFIEENKIDLLTKEEDFYCIIPNYYGVFKAKNDLYKNKNIPLKLIECGKKFGEDYDYNTILVKEEFKNAFSSSNEKSLVKFSNSIRSAIERRDKITEINEKQNFLNAILSINSYSNDKNFEKQKKLFSISNYFYPPKKDESIEVELIADSDDFDWSYANEALIEEILSKFTTSEKKEGIKNLQELSSEVYSRDYILNNDFEVDSCINKIIEFVHQYYPDLLNKYAIIPDKNNCLHTFYDNIYNDVFDKEEYDAAIKENKDYLDNIPEKLKDILLGFGRQYDINNKLKHNGVNIELKKSLDVIDICRQLDEVVMEYRDSSEPKIKQNIRKLDNWISKKIQSSQSSIWTERLKKSFTGFYELRAGIAYNTLSIEEKEKSGNIIYSGHLDELSKIVEVIKKQDENDKQPLIEAVMDSLRKEDDKIQRTKFYKNLGKTVENIFQDITGANTHIEDNGQDFLLLNSLLQIGIRLEIKSRSRRGNYVLMTKWQATNAVSCKEEYVLCIFPDVSNSTPENFKLKAKFILDIKNLLEEKYSKAETFVKENILENSTEEIQLEFENRAYKYKINKSVWERQNNVLSYQGFESYIKEKMNKKIIHKQ